MSRATIPYDPDWVKRQTVEGALSPLLRASSQRFEDLREVVKCLDLTTLSGDESESDIESLCSLARSARTAAVCVFPRHVPLCRTFLQGSGVEVATVAGRFPTGRMGTKEKVEEILHAVSQGATEVDVTIDRTLALAGRWEELYAEAVTIAESAGSTCLKMILGTGDFADCESVARASLVCMMAGADFIKTSSGKEKVNAALDSGLVMVRAIREFQDVTGQQVGFKPAGGIRTAADALAWLSLVAGELGEEATTPRRFRIGASSLLQSILTEIGAN